MIKPLRVLQILTNLDRGGMETMTMNFYRYIDRKRVQFDFLLHREKEGDYEAEARSLGARIFRVPRQNPLDPRYWQALDSFFASHPYQVVHAQLDCLSALPLAVAKRYGTPVRIAHSHNSRQDHDIKYPLKLICKKFIRYEATDLFACGVDAGKWMFGTDDFTVVRNAINVDSYTFNETCRERTRKSLGISSDTFVVGHVGRFVPAKNHILILDIFSSLLRLRPNSVLLLVGDGDLRAKIECRAANLGISESVRFLGLRSDVPNLMQAMDVFLMPSLYEGLPLVLIEAQAAGLPCVISKSIPEDCDLTGQYITRIALEEDPVKWAEQLIAQPESAKRGNGSSVVRAAGFDVTDVAKKLEKFYLKKAGVKI